MKDLTWRISRQGSEAVMILEGEFNDTADFRSLQQETLDSPLVVDFGGVTRINSTGLRVWMNLVTKLNESGVQVCLDRCSPPIVGQLNLISNFAGEGGPGRVRSVFAPYHCASCDQEHMELVDRASSADIPETSFCLSCGSATTFSDLIEMYFSFWMNP